MSNTTGNDRLATHPWDRALALRRQYAIPAANTTFYSGQFVGRDASGNIVQADDTAKYELVGILQEILRETVYTGDNLGDKLAQQIERPLVYTSLIASAAAGDEGRMVFILYNNQVSYSPGSNANFAGWVWRVLDSTHVAVIAPWANHVTAGGNRGIYTTAVSGTVNLTKWDIHKTIAMPLTGSATINLPAAASVSPGDDFVFLNTGSASAVATITPAGSDMINGSASLAMSAVQYATLTVRSDGVSKWYSSAQNVSGTLGATTFTGGVAVNSANLVIDDNSGNTLTAGPNGTTNPTLNVDCSVSMAATGIDIIGRAAGAGVTLAVTTSGTNDDLLVAPAGSGGVKITSNGSNSLAVGRQGSTSPTLLVDSSTSTCVTGMKLKSAASGGGFALSFIGGTNEVVTVDTNGSGALTLQSIGTGNVLIGSGCLVNGGTGGIGYGTGVGGTVTQITSRTTGVTLNKLTGAITLVSAAGSGTAFTMTVTNSTVAAGDTVVVSQKSGTDIYSVVVSGVSTGGQFKMTITDLTGTTTEQPVFSFVVVKGVAA